MVFSEFLTALRMTKDTRRSGFMNLHNNEVSVKHINAIH